MTSTGTADIFNTKYNEFCNDLAGACPEFSEQIKAALQLTPEQRKDLFKEQVLPFCSPTRDASQMPEVVLPGVKMSADVWNQLSDKSKTAIQEYLTLLSFCFMMDNGAADLSGQGFTAEWAKSMMDDMKKKMNSVDFKGLSEKFAKFFGASADGIPQIPEKFLKGQIAKLAEEIVKEFNIEDLGIDPAMMEAAGNDPSKALNIVMDVFLKNPASLQNTLQKLTKKLQQKVQNGSLRPQELVAEAEELMKTFSENPAFVEMMEGFRQAFSMEGHEDDLRAAGRDGNARLSLVQQRLRKKLEAKKAGQNKK